LVSKWLLRIELIKKKMIKLNIKLTDIKNKIKECFTNYKFLIVTNHENAEKPILRLRIINS